LLDRLHESRVRKILDAIIIGQTAAQNFSLDDLQYVRDLGLIKLDSLEIANPIYQEIIPRELTSGTMQSITETSADYIREDGSLDVNQLLTKFTEFYRQNADAWLEKFDYKESGPHLLMMAFLQRVINGGGDIQREYALGRERVDLLIKWKTQSIVIEIKLLRGPSTLKNGLTQTAQYMETSGATEGHLFVFDKSPDKSWSEKIYQRTETQNGKSITVWGA